MPNKNIPEEALLETWNIFKTTILKGKESVAELIERKKDDTEWDLTRIYYPDHACLWNKPSNINKACKIMCKNSFIAIVYFSEEIATEENLLKRIYRLEDLSTLQSLM